MPTTPQSYGPGTGLTGVPWNPARWWESPGVRFEADGSASFGTIRFNPVMPPEWAGFSPQQFYMLQQQVLPALPESQRPFAEAGLLDTSEARNIQNEGRLAAIGTIEEGLGSIGTAIEEFGADPTRSFLREQLTARAGAGPDQYRETQRAGNLSLARARARAGEYLQSGAAGRGTEFGPGLATREALLDAAFSGAGVQLGAQIEGMREASRMAALTGLSGLSNAENTFLAQLRDQALRYRGGLADLEAGIAVQPTDYLAYGELAESQRQFDQEMAALNAAAEAANAAQQVNWFDIGNAMISAIGTGLYDRIF